MQSTSVTECEAERFSMKVELGAIVLTITATALLTLTQTPAPPVISAHDLKICDIQLGMTVDQVKHIKGPCPQPLGELLDNPLWCFDKTSAHTIRTEAYYSSSNKVTGIYGWRLTSTTSPMKLTKGEPLDEPKLLNWLGPPSRTFTHAGWQSHSYHHLRLEICSDNGRIEQFRLGKVANQ